VTKKTTQKNPAAQALGKLGGKARARKLTPEQRSEAARRAALAQAAAMTSAQRVRRARRAAAARKTKGKEA